LEQTGEAAGQMSRLSETFFDIGMEVKQSNVDKLFVEIQADYEAGLIIDREHDLRPTRRVGSMAHNLKSFSERSSLTRREIVACRICVRFRMPTRDIGPNWWWTVAMITALSFS
jgi:hypothetical protein